MRYSIESVTFARGGSRQRDERCSTIDVNENGNALRAFLLYVQTQHETNTEFFLVFSPPPGSFAFLHGSLAPLYFDVPPPFPAHFSLSLFLL